MFGESEEFVYEIEPFDTLDIKGSCFSGIESYCDIGWIRSDYNATIVFSNTKIQRFDSLPENENEKAIQANPFSSVHGYSRSDENGITIYTYVITEEDYNSAEPIDE